MSKHNGEGKFAQKWVSYRPEIKVLDVTVRDGGLMNNHHFSDEVVRGVYDACVQGGIDYMEIGYKGSKKIFSGSEYGPWKFCDEADVRRTFEALSEGAEIIMPVGATFWSKAFGMLKDRFGVSWMVTLVQAE